MEHVLRHPRVQSAVTKNQIVPGLPIKWYGLPGGEHFVKSGFFTSHPYEDGHGETLVRVYFDDQSTKRGKEMSLITLGILPNSDGEWSNCATISTEDDGDDMY